MEGLVVKNTGSSYAVKIDTGEILMCKIKGNFRVKDIRTTNPVAVGDIVLVTKNEQGLSLIYGICNRKNYIIRKSPNLSKESHIIAANIDQAMLLITINHPKTSTVFIDRFLVSAGVYNIPVVLIFNKIDLYSSEEIKYLDALQFLYENIGYLCIRTSVKTLEGIETLKQQLGNKVTLFSGNSGVGKSSMINAIDETLSLRTGIVSESHDKGIHTTTFSEMFVIAGGYIIDTPGVKGFGVVNVDPAEVGHYFPEIFEKSKDCKYYNCTHINEPGCAVVSAVEKHQISQSRYTSYLSIFENKDSSKYR